MQAPRDRLAQQMVALLPAWSLSEAVAALQALRDVAVLSAITLVAEIGDVRRFTKDCQAVAPLMGPVRPNVKADQGDAPLAALFRSGELRARRQFPGAD